MKRYSVNLLFVMTVIFLLSRVSFSLTVEEVVKLKKAGVSDETIQLMIQQESVSKKADDPYKNIGVRKVTEPDGRSSTVYSTGEIDDRENYDEESEREKREKSWDMLDNIIIDGRDGRRPLDRKEKR